MDSCIIYIYIYLVEIEVVVEGDGVAELGLVADPGDGVAADGEENEGHVELEGLGGALGGADAVAHDVVDGAVAVLDELPGEEARADAEPEGHDPHPLPVVLQKVLGLLPPPPDRVRLLRRPQVLAQHLAQVPAVRRPAPHRLARPLQQKQLQIVYLNQLYIHMYMYSDPNS